MKKPYIKVTFSNGKCFGIPAKVVAEHRAKYYADKDPDTTYEEEIDFLLGSKTLGTGPDEFEIIDWAKNDMNWNELQRHAEELESEEPNYDDEWTNADSEVIV